MRKGRLPSWIAIINSSFPLPHNLVFDDHSQQLDSFSPILNNQYFLFNFNATLSCFDNPSSDRAIIVKKWLLSSKSSGIFLILSPNPFVPSPQPSAYPTLFPTVYLRRSSWMVAPKEDQSPIAAAILVLAWISLHGTKRTKNQTQWETEAEIKRLAYALDSSWIAMINSSSIPLLEFLALCGYQKERDYLFLFWFDDMQLLALSLFAATGANDLDLSLLLVCSILMKLSLVFW